MRYPLFALSAAAILAASANAADLSGLSAKVSGGYNYSGTKDISSNAFDFGGAVNYALPDTRLNVQGLVDYSESKTLKTPVDTWTSGGALTWREPAFAFGVAGDYKSSRLIGADFNSGSYGVVGEFYLAQDITLRLNGGGLSGSFAGVYKDGGYYGGGASYYVLPNLSLNVHGDYASVSALRWTNFEAGVEYLPCDTLPVSISTAYTQGNINAAGFSAHSDGLMVRLSYHLGEGNSLVGFDRSGPLNTYTPSLPYEAATAASYKLIKG